MFNDPYVKNNSEKAAYYIFSHICNVLDIENKIVMTINTDLSEVLDEIGLEELTKRLNDIKFEDIEIYYPVPNNWKMTKRSFNMGKRLLVDKSIELDKNDPYKRYK